MAVKGIGLRTLAGQLLQALSLAAAAMLLAGAAMGQEPVAEPQPVPDIAEQIQPPPTEAPIQQPGVTPFGPSLPPTGMPPIGPVTPPPLLPGHRMPAIVL